MSTTLRPAVPSGQLFDQGMTPDVLGLSSSAFPQLSAAFNSGSTPAPMAPATSSQTGASTPASSGAPGSWASQPVGVKIAVYSVAVGLVLVGLLGLVLPAAEKTAPAMAAAV
jgi:hypothetical protein